MSRNPAGIVPAFALLPPQSTGLDGAPGDGAKSAQPVELSDFE
jgi:hypothetical protein